MIIDTHVYIFTRPDRPEGSPEARTRMGLLQSLEGSHHQPAWRIRDRAVVDASHLVGHDAAGREVYPDVDLRIDDEHGRVVWTQDGEDVTKQVFPPALTDLAWSAGSCIGAMDYAGVDVALIHTDPMLHQAVDDLGAWCRRYPDRLRSMAPVEEWRIPGEPDAVIEELRYAIKVAGLHALKFIPDYAYLQGGKDAWDGPAFRPFWDAFATMGVPVFFTLGASPEVPDERLGYIDELERVGRLMARYPDLQVGLTHGFPYRLFLDGDRLRFPERIWAPFQDPRLHLEVSFPIRVGDVFDYPYREVWPALAEMIERVGVDQLTWGTDMPFQDRFCTYRQSRDWLERHAPISASERSAIMGGTAARLLGIG